MQRRQRFHRTEGQSIVLVALALVALVGIAGLGLDGANAYNQRRNAGNAADAAAMAGSNAIISQRKASSSNPQSSGVYTTVTQYLTSHGIDPTSARTTWAAYYVNNNATRIGTVSTSGNIPTEAKGVAVDLLYKFDTFFMGVLGRSELPASGTATAMYGPVSSVTGSDVVPFTLSATAVTAVQNGGAIDIDSLAPGNFGSVSFNPNGSPNATGNDCNGSYTDSQSYYWCNGSPQYPVYSGEVLPGDTGNIAVSLEDEIETRIGDVVLMPVYSSVTGTGNNTQFTIIGFIAVRLLEVDLHDSDRSFTIEYVNYTSTPGAFSNGAVDTGVYAVNLVK